MIAFPKSVDEALAAPGTFRAGATDLQERRQHHISEGPVVDLRDVPGLDAIEEVGANLLIGARVPIAALAEHARVREGWPGLAQAAGGLATPQIRARGTVGGNLLQAVRCWYYRSPRFNCLKKGGSTCLAREGDHLYHACFDQGACVAPHPSTLGMAFLAYDADALVRGADERSMADLLGDGRDPRRNHTLPDGALLTHVVLPLASGGRVGAYARTIARARSEWPLVEAVVALDIAAESGVEGVPDPRRWPGATIRSARVAIGGVANTPMRLPKVEAALAGKGLTEEVFEAAAALATRGATPLRMTAYKVDLIAPTLIDAFERALTGGAS